MTTTGRALLILAQAAAFASPSLAQEAEDAYRIRASIYAGKALVTAASWVGVTNRETTVRQTFSTPYRRDTALSEAGRSADGTLEGEVRIVVRPFEHDGGLCLDVEIDSRTVSRLHHYRGDALLEVLPGGGRFGAGGDYCDYEETADGLLFDLSHGDEEDYGEILVRPETPILEDADR
jgi:hypothetical protein